MKSSVLEIKFNQIHREFRDIWSSLRAMSKDIKWLKDIGTIKRGDIHACAHQAAVEAARKSIDYAAEYEKTYNKIYNMLVAKYGDPLNQ